MVSEVLVYIHVCENVSQCSDAHDGIIAVCGIDMLRLWWASSVLLATYHMCCTKYYSSMSLWILWLCSNNGTWTCWHMCTRNQSSFGYCARFFILLLVVLVVLLCGCGHAVDVTWILFSKVHIGWEFSGRKPITLTLRTCGCWFGLLTLREVG